MIATVTNQGKTRWMIIDEAFDAEKFIEFLTALIKDAGKRVFSILDVGDLDVAEVGRQRQHPLTHVNALIMPEHQPEHGKGVAKVVDARRAMAATIDPTELPPKFVEDAVDFAVRDRLAQQPSAAGDEERQLGRAAHILRT